MFENLLRRIRGESPEPPKFQSNDLGLKIETESDGLKLRKTAGDLATGDRLLLSFTLDGKNWERRVVEFQDERGGMFIYLGARPLGAVVVHEDDVLEKREFKGVKRSAYQSRRVSSEDRWPDTYHSTDDFFNPFNPLSPYYGHNFNNPLGLYSLYSQLTDSNRREDPPVSPSVLDQLRAPDPDTGGHRHFEPPAPSISPDTNAPPANPFDPRGINLEVPLPESGTNTIHGFHHSSTNSLDHVEIKGDDKGFDSPREAEAPSPAADSPSFNDPSPSSEPNAYH